MKKWLLSAGALICFSAIAEKQPNIVFFMVDDQHRDVYNFLPGNQKVEGRINLPTPQLDSMAENGVVLGGMHVASPVCIPSRFTIMTGTYASRCISDEFAAGSWKWGYPWVAQNTHTTHETQTIPQALKKAGYRTGAVGKNHVIEVSDYQSLPYSADINDPNVKRVLAENAKVQKKAYHQAGFDYAERLYYNNTLANGPRVLNPHNLDWCTEGALEFLDSCGDQPFFLYYASTAPHGPYGDWMKNPLATPEGMLSERPRGHPERSTIAARLRERGFTPKHQKWKVYGDAVWLDDALAALKKKLAENEQLENTIIIYFNDHGVESGKTTVYQGGLHSIALVDGPEEYVKGGRIDWSLTASVDFGRTILGWADALNYKQTLDGVDLAPLLEGRVDKVRDSIYGEIGMSRAVRKGNWKYIALREPDYLKNMPLEMRQAPIDECRRRMKKQGRKPFPNKATDPFAHIGWLPGGWDNTWSAMKEHPHYFDVDQLYNLADDPHELVNLAGDPQYADVLEKIKKELSGYLSRLPGKFGEF